MMVEGGQAEGGDVQTKDMRTEINGGNASDPQNFELKHVLQNPEGGNLSSAEAGEAPEFERRKHQIRRNLSHHMPDVLDASIA